MPGIYINALEIHGSLRVELAAVRLELRDVSAFMYT